MKLWLYKLQTLLKKIITPKTTENGKSKDSMGHDIRKTFPCDSHPAFCFTCTELRQFLDSHKFPKVSMINCKDGVHIRFKAETVHLHIKGEGNFYCLEQSVYSFPPYYFDNPKGEIKMVELKQLVFSDRNGRFPPHIEALLQQTYKKKCSI